jgi:hypothetical protein
MMKTPGRAGFSINGGGPSLGSETHAVGLSKMVAQASACERHRINNLARGSLESLQPGLQPRSGRRLKPPLQAIACSTKSVFNGAL